MVKYCIVVRGKKSGEGREGINLALAGAVESRYIGYIERRIRVSGVHVSESSIYLSFSSFSSSSSSSSSSSGGDDLMVMTMTMMMMMMRGRMFYSSRVLYSTVEKVRGYIHVYTVYIFIYVYIESRESVSENSLIRIDFLLSSSSSSSSSSSDMEQSVERIYL